MDEKTIEGSQVKRKKVNGDLAIWFGGDVGLP
jgi:hypothetical protein